MIRIEPEPWRQMVEHARATYPNECCGAMLGNTEDGRKVVTTALPLENAYAGAQAARYELRQQDLLDADREARSRKMDLVGIYHSHPDAEAYFSPTDLQNSCPWYSFVVLSIRKGEFRNARCFVPNLDQSASEEEELSY
jgi:proteasome lid subunit RPN8/RPN11